MENQQNEVIEKKPLGRPRKFQLPVQSFQEEEVKSPETPSKPDASVQGAISAIMTELQDLRKDRDILLSIADKNQLAKYYSKHQSKLPKVVRLRSLSVTNAEGITEEKLIIGWETITNRVWKERPNLWMEDQKIKLIFNDGTSLVMDYLKYAQQYNLTIEAMVTARTIEEESGDEMLKVVRKDNGQELLIKSTFVN